MSFTLVEHPLVAHLLTQLRDRNTVPRDFRLAAKRLTYPLVLEATRSLPLREHPIETPLESTTGRSIGAEIVAIPVLRAGLGLLEAVTDIYPDVSVGYAGLARDETTAIPQRYYLKLPPLNDRFVLVLEPMLATGGSLSATMAQVKLAGARDIAAICVVAAPQGLARMESEHPDVPVFAAALDRELDANYYIRPGLGDMGDRLFGTVPA